MARVFSAVDIEDEKLLDELADVRDRLDLGFKPVERNKMHITLEFFQDADQEEIETLKKTIRDISMPSFTVKIKGVGAFPSKDYIRVVWAGARSEKMQKLYSEVTDHLVESDNDHEFTPHVTLFRVENISPGKKDRLRKSIREFSDHGFGELEVAGVKLFESRFTDEGSEYSVIERVKL